jgi:hypothetical protein
MSLRRCFLLLMMTGAGFCSFAQKIVYSEPEKDDTRRLNFEIAGKIGGNFLIYKNIRNKNWIAVLDNDLKQIGSVEMDYVPDNDRMINVDFFPFSDFCYMIYQYQKKNVVYCMAAKIDGNGQKSGDVMELDTTHIGFAASNRIYSVLSSEDKSRIGIFKINSRNRKVYVMTTLLMNDKLELVKRSRMTIPMEERYDYVNDFHLDNEGDMVFTKFYRNSNDNISKAFFVVKPALSDSLRYTELRIDNTYLDEIHIKVDNFNKRYLLTSFYYKQRRGNIDGFYFYIWDKTTGKPVIEDTTIFSEELKREAKGDNNVKSAFNDYFIRHIIPRRDGGFLLGSESYYTTSRFNSWSRWDYLYGSAYSPVDNYYYSPYYNNYWWSSRSSNQAMRFHSDNITVLSFDKNANLEWSSVIGKEQFDDQSDDLLSYQMMNTGGALHFLFNKDEKRALLLNDYSLTPAGSLSHNPTLKNLDKGYEFMPKFAKQVSARQMIIPCQYRNYICFAKIDYN